MENLALVALVENLRPAMAELIIRRIVQHQPNGFIFQTRSPKLAALKFIVEPQNPSLYASEARPPMEAIWQPGGVWARFIGDADEVDLPHRGPL